MKKDLLLNNLIEDGDGINTDVDGFSKEQLDKLRQAKPVPSTQLPDDLAEAIQLPVAPPAELYVKYCNTCGNHRCKLEHRNNKDGLVLCTTCIGRSLETFPARYCKYCGKNIPGAETTLRSFCDACNQLPRNRRSNALPKGIPT